MRLILFSIILLAVSFVTCKQISSTPNHLYFSPNYGLIDVADNSKIKFMSVDCIHPKIWYKQGSNHVDRNSMELKGCRRNPNKSHSMVLHIKHSEALEVSSSDSCFTTIYNSGHLIFKPLLERYDWTHVTVTVTQDPEMSATISKQEFSDRIKASSIEEQVLTVDQQIWVLFNSKAGLYSTEIHPRVDFQITLFKNYEVIESTQMNKIVCYLSGLQSVVHGQFSAFMTGSE